jgi:hypothetical protein
MAASLKNLAAEKVRRKLGQSNSAATKLSTHPDVALNSEDRMLDNFAHLSIAENVALVWRTRRQGVRTDQRITLRSPWKKRH